MWVRLGLGRHRLRPSVLPRLSAPSSQGVCLPGGQCTCSAGWTDPSCGTPVCALNCSSNYEKLDVFLCNECGFCKHQPTPTWHDQMLQLAQDLLVPTSHPFALPSTSQPSRMPRSASLAALPQSAATKAVSPSLVITDITGSGGNGGLRMPLPARLGPLSPVGRWRPSASSRQARRRAASSASRGHPDSVGRLPTSPNGLRRHEDGSLARNVLMPILPPSTAVGPRVVRAVASGAIDAIGPVHGFGGPGMPYLEHHSLLMKRNRSLEMAVKRMGAELSQWREEGSSREEAHRLKLLEQLDARHEHEREKYEARLRAAAEESLRALEKQRAELIGQGGASQYARRLREKQIEHLTQMAARRMGRQQLGRGWRAWMDLFLESRRRERVLCGAASRLLQRAL